MAQRIPKESHYGIGLLSQKSGVPTTTIRYYILRGILKPIGRDKNNYKLFDESSLFKLLRINELKKEFPNMSLDEIVKEINEVEGL